MVWAEGQWASHELIWKTWTPTGSPGTPSPPCCIWSPSLSVSGYCIGSDGRPHLPTGTAPHRECLFFFTCNNATWHRSAHWSRSWAPFSVRWGQLRGWLGNSCSNSRRPMLDRSVSTVAKVKATTPSGTTLSFMIASCKRGGSPQDRAKTSYSCWCPIRYAPWCSRSMAQRGRAIWQRQDPPSPQGTDLLAWLSLLWHLYKVRSPCHQSPLHR